MSNDQYAAAEVAAKVYRGEAVEAVHRADIAVVDSSGKLTHYLGNPDAVYMARSSIKPFQALPLILSGGFDHFGFDAEHLAIMASSHSGTDEHREVVLSTLDKAGLTVDDLQCGADWPLYIQFENIYPPTEDKYDPLRNDCSGKHAGFLALAKYLGLPTKTYLDPDSELQQKIKNAVAEICEYPAEKMSVGIDGCSAPNLSFPVRNLALGFLNLATRRSDREDVAEALGRVMEAMTDHPYLVAGHRRFCYDFMRSFPGVGVTKLGAESIQGIGLSDPPVGIAVKVADGGIRALGPICVGVLKRLGIIGDISDYPLLEPYEAPEIRNARQIVTGRIRVDFELKTA